MSHYTPELDFSTVPDNLGLAGVVARTLVQRLDYFAAEEWHWTDNDGRKAGLRTILLDLTPAVPVRTLDWTVMGLMNQIQGADNDIHIYDEHMRVEVSCEPGVDAEMDGDDGDYMTGTWFSPVHEPSDTAWVGVPISSPVAAATTHTSSEDNTLPTALSRLAEVQCQLAHTRAAYNDLQLDHVTLDHDHQLLHLKVSDLQVRISAMAANARSAGQTLDALMDNLHDLRNYKETVEQARSVFNHAINAAGAAHKETSASSASHGDQPDDSGVMDMS